jgi:DNA-binding transcriptional LysR family regulator
MLRQRKRLSRGRRGSKLRPSRSNVGLGPTHSVTALVQALEREFERPLLERLGKRVMLTEAGSRLLSYGGRLTQIVDEARAAVGGDGPLDGTA